MTTIPDGLAREHRWYPHADAIRVATARERYWDIDDYLDRYLMRVKARGTEPSSQEFLTWLIDDCTRAERAERASAQSGANEVDDQGIPRSWRKR